MTTPVDPSVTTEPPDETDLLASLRRMGLLDVDERPPIMPLVGGVSSDIRLVAAARGPFCVKRALARLKVAALWEVPVGRNAAEVAWMRHVDEWLPGATPTILGEDRAAGLFAMAYLEPTHHPLWKTQLLDGIVDDAFAAGVGGRLATIHARSAGEPTLAATFANEQTFDDIRLDPYLRATGRAHPALRARFEALADRTRAMRGVLVHGDVSPKNILAGPKGPVFLDAECACMGDPAFDLGFCLNHLLLKGARAGIDPRRYAGSFERLSRAYLAGVTWEDAAALEARAASLLPALLLARIDGKSPVEYLTTEAEREAVRRRANPIILDPPPRLDTIAAAWIARP
jgi:hypothetical protein